MSYLQTSTVFTVELLVYSLIDASHVLDDQCHVPAWLSTALDSVLYTLTLLIAFKALHACKQVFFCL